MEEPPEPALSGRWPLDDAATLRAELVAAYADPARGYHDTRHLAEVLGRLEELAAHGEIFDRVPVLLAAWFHDAVYDGERDAEERSAAWAEAELPGVDGLEAADVAEVARLVRLTETHRPEADDVNGCALSDADLGVLAADEDRYRAYVQGVRREYAHLSAEEFRRGRTEVLSDLAAKPRLFHTRHALEQWEDRARANLARELAELTAGRLAG